MGGWFYTIHNGILLMTWLTRACRGAMGRSFSRYAHGMTPGEIKGHLEALYGRFAPADSRSARSSSSPLKKSEILKKVIASSYRPFLDWLK